MSVHLDAPPRPTLALLADVLVREASVGTVLWTYQDGDYRIAAVLNLAVFGLTILGTRRLGLTRPREWGLTLREGVLVFAGGICIAHLITYLFGLPAWVQP